MTLSKEAIEYRLLTSKGVPMSRSRQKAVLNALIRARDRISPPGRWVRRRLAVTRSGNTIGPRTPGAAAWCAIGSLEAEIKDRNVLLSARSLLDMEARGVGRSGIVSVNDGIGKKKTLEVFDRAIHDLTEYLEATE